MKFIFYPIISSNFYRCLFSYLTYSIKDHPTIWPSEVPATIKGPLDARQVICEGVKYSFYLGKLINIVPFNHLSSLC